MRKKTFIRLSVATFVSVLIYRIGMDIVKSMGYNDLNLTLLFLAGIGCGVLFGIILYEVVDNSVGGL